MCFLYRQSISIVYESKFKYIYRYFIKIDRCFCGILLSLPLWKCGLKLIVFFGNQTDLRHFPCGSVDWNISTGDTYICCIQSLPLWKCGLKWCRHVQYAHDVLSLPLWKCGLKSRWNNQWWRRNTVTSLVEVWIEIFHHNTKGNVWKSHFPCGSVDWNRL